MESTDEDHTLVRSCKVSTKETGENAEVTAK
jgi:hypothetical protein